MEKKTNFVGAEFWNKLVLTCRELRYVPPYGPGASPLYSRLVYNSFYHLITFEVERGELPGFPEGHSSITEFSNRLSGYFNSTRLDIVDLGSALYFNFWVSSMEQGNLVEPAELVYA